MLESKLERIQFEAPQTTLAEIDTLLKPCGKLTRPALYDNALTLLTWFIDERTQGRRIVSIGEDSNHHRDLLMSLHETAGFRSKLVRVQFDVATSMLAEIDALTTRCGGITRRALFDNSLTILIWAIKERRGARRIVSVGEDNKHRELVMPFLETVANGNF